MVFMAFRKMMRAGLVGLLIGLSSCSPTVYEGTVCNKWHEPPNKSTMTIPQQIGKTFTYHRITRNNPEAYIIQLKVEGKNKKQIEFPVSSKDYRNIHLGDHIVYEKNKSYTINRR